MEKSKPENILPLFEKLKNGDLSAWENLYKVFFPKLKTYGLQITGYKHEPEIVDAIHELFLWMAKNLDKLQAIHSFEAYLFQSVRKNILSKLSRLVQQQVKNRLYEQSSFLKNLDIEEISQEDNLISRENNFENYSKLFTAIQDLPTHLKEIIYLRYYEELSHKEVASILNINEQVARNYLSRAIKKLKKALISVCLMESAFMLSFTFYFL